MWHSFACISFDRNSINDFVGPFWNATEKLDYTIVQKI